MRVTPSKTLIEQVAAGKPADRAVREDGEDQLAMGRKVELEHADTIRWIKDHPEASVEEVAERIAQDHLNEIPDYYTRLKDMESKAGVQ